MANKYNIKWAHIIRESDGTVEYSRSISHFVLDFSDCRGIELTDFDRSQDEDYIREVYEQKPGLNDFHLEEDGQDLSEETVADFADAIAAVIDNGGIEMGSKPNDDHILETVVVYDANDAEIYRLEWYDVDEQSDNDPVNEQFFDIYLEINLAM